MAFILSTCLLAVIFSAISFTSPERFVTDSGLYSGIDLIVQIAAIFAQHEYECEIIAASLRNPIQVREAAEAGAHIATIPFSVLKSMVVHPGSADGIDAFTNDLVDEYIKLLE